MEGDQTMRRKSTTVFVLLVLTLILAACVSPFQKKYTVQGTIKGEEGKGIANVTLTFSGDYTGTTKTGLDGSWIINDTKGTVTITPRDEFYTFLPGSIKVTNERNNVNFVAVPTPEKCALDVVKRMQQALVDGDADAYVACVDDSYFEKWGLTRQEFLQTIRAELASVDITSIDFKYDRSHSICETTKVIICGKITIEGIYDNQPVTIEGYTGFIIEKKASGWLFTGEIQYSPEKEILQKSINTFLNAFQEEDLATIKTLLTDECKNSFFVTELQSHFDRVEMTGYIIVDQAYSRSGNTNWVELNVDFTVNDENGTRTISSYFNFSFSLQGDKWLIYSANFIWNYSAIIYHSIGVKTIPQWLLERNHSTTRMLTWQRKQAV